MPKPDTNLQSVTGVQLAQGLGVQPARGFWADVWAHVLKRNGARFGLAWVAVVAFFAVFSPLIASGHPIWMVEQTAEGTRRSSPLLHSLSAADVALLLGSLAGLLLLLAPLRLPRAERGVMLFFGALQVMAIVVLGTALSKAAQQREVPRWLGHLREWPQFPYVAPGVIALVAGAMFGLIPFGRSWRSRIAFVVTASLIGGFAIGWAWKEGTRVWDYRAREARGEIVCTYAPVPFSPAQRSTEYFTQRPGASLFTPTSELVLRAVRSAIKQPSAPRAEVLPLPVDDTLRPAIRAVLASGGELLPLTGEALARAFDGATCGTVGDVVDWLLALPSDHFTLGTDNLGQDVLAQMLHACRLSISIGLVSTSIAVVIGVTIGALMGYFGGKVDLLLYRLVEIFMAIPVLFLLIVASAVLPKSTYVMMAIIGCVTWTSAARFTRAEFLKLRSQDFVQSARAAGLPLRSILFRHMLPNGVTPVLVESSFAIAAAILAEATLSYLGLGPENQASWGRLLSGSKSDAANFVWWLALFPGLAIFLTVLAYNLVGEALRDAIDPKLKKARV
ncbi:MAG: ABC transporter permease [Phycisphaerales bacterium]|nr:ABC transporter permease [Phycisphaerales bacterium]